MGEFLDFDRLMEEFKRELRPWDVFFDTRLFRKEGDVGTRLKKNLLYFKNNYLVMGGGALLLAAVVVAGHAATHLGKDGRIQATANRIGDKVGDKVNSTINQKLSQAEDLVDKWTK